MEELEPPKLALSDVTLDFLLEESTLPAAIVVVGGAPANRALTRHSSTLDERAFDRTSHCGNGYRVPMGYQTTVTIDAPADDVWAVLTDVERWPEWTASMQRIERSRDGELAVGSTVRIKQPRVPATSWEVTELDPGRSFTWVATTPGVTTIAEHRLEPTPSGVAVHLGIRRSGPLAGLVDRLSARLTRRYVGMEAQGLKRRCEGR